jgi:hypothetical protein
MLKFEELSEEKQAEAVLECIEDIFLNLVQDDVVPDFLMEFEDVCMEAMAEAERCKTPWFFLDILQEEIEENEEMKACILAEAERVAKMSWYASTNENVIYLFDEEKTEEVKVEEKKKNLKLN